MDDREKALNTDIVNAGVYYISTEIYKEFEEKEELKEEIKMIEHQTSTDSINLQESMEQEINVIELDESYARTDNRINHTSFHLSDRKGIPQN